MILIRHRKIKMISDGKKLPKLLLFKMIIPKMKSFMQEHSSKDNTMNDGDFKKLQLSNIS